MLISALDTLSMNPFTLHIPKDIEAQLRQCRMTVRRSIQKRLREIVAGLTVPIPVRRPARSRAITATGPPLRFYVFEGYRVSYEVNPVTRSVVVLKLRTEPCS